MTLRNWLSRWNTKVWDASLPRDWEEFAQVDRPALAPLFEFTAWPKTSRLFRDIVITEKLDGTNAAILISRVTNEQLWDHLATDDQFLLAYKPADDESAWVVGAQSRNRVISIQADNQGFAKWVRANAATLIEDLGEGRHFGEFWGQGIGRKYDLDHKRFSLFNPVALGDIVGQTPGLGVVPTLYTGPLNTDAIRDTLIALKANGSQAAPGYGNPEGIIVYHTHARRILGKVTLDNQDAGKWES